MKETYYFSHDYNARNDEKILELRSEFKSDGYAAYFMMLESMAENEDSGLNRVAIGGLSLGYNIPKGKLEKIIQKAVDIGLFVEEGSRFYSPRMREHKEFRLSLSEAGKLGAKKRWGEKKNSPPNAPPNAKERKGKERKEFKAPTIENCVEYAKTIGFSGPVAFFEHYENTDWQKKTKNGELVPLKNWKLTMRTWLEKDIKHEKEANQLNNTEWAAIDISSLESIPNEQWKHLQSIFDFDRKKGYLVHSEQQKYVQKEDLKKSKRLQIILRQRTQHAVSNYTTVNYGTPID